MRTAEEILNSKLTYGANTYDAGQRNNIIKAINEARKEAIEECAERAETKPEHDYHGDGEGYEYNVVDKQSILSLIDELK